nr:MAG TPA: hypothetical protein [Caudoviricetes sp.]
MRFKIRMEFVKENFLVEVEARSKSSFCRDFSYKDS